MTTFGILHDFRQPLPHRTDISQYYTECMDEVVAAQHHLHGTGHSEGQTYLGVTFARRSFGATFSEGGPAMSYERRRAAAVKKAISCRSWWSSSW